MPTTDFFSGPGFEPENTPDQPDASNRRPADPQQQDDAFAGMQKLDFDFLNDADDTQTKAADKAPGNRSAVFSGVQPAARMPQKEPRTAQQPSASVFDGVPEMRLTPMVSASFDDPDASSAPEQTAPQRNSDPAQPLDAVPQQPVAKSGKADESEPFDFGILEDQLNAAAPEGYVPLSLDFLDDDAPKAAAPAAKPAAQPAAPEAQKSAQTAGDENPFDFDFGILEDNSAAPAAKPAAQPAAPEAQKSAQPAGDESPFDFDFGILEDNSAAPAAKPAAQPAAPEAQKSAQPAATAEKTSVQPDEPALTDEPTVAFTPASMRQEAPTAAFTPVKSASAATVEAPVAAQQTPQMRAARAAKEKNIGAAVFSALMEDGDSPAQPAAGKPSDSAPVMRPSGWPSVSNTPNGPRTPRPINWHTPPASSAKPAQPTPTPKQEAAFDAAKQEDTLDFDGAQPLDLFDGLQDDYTPQPEPEEPFAGLYDQDPDDAEPAPRAPRASGRSGSRAPRRSSGAKRTAPNKTLLGWIGLIAVAVIIILCFVLFGGGDDPAPVTSSSTSAPDSTSLPAQSTVTSSSVAPVEAIPRDEWYMVLANRDNRLPSDFVVTDTVTVGNAVVDARIAESLQQMIDAAAAEGITLQPVNGYRSVERQQSLWDARVQSLMQSGLSQEEAEARAIDYTSPPGASDHNTGLGLDIVSADHPAQDAAFAETQASQWLVAHAAEYGFILRYPADKTEATGMDYEPWHYRYVSSEQALKIQASGLCLEEYLAQ